MVALFWGTIFFGVFTCAHLHLFALKVVTCCIVYVPMDSHNPPPFKRPRKNRISFFFFTLWHTSKQVAPFHFIDMTKWRNQVSQHRHPPAHRQPFVAKFIREKKRNVTNEIESNIHNSWIMKKVWIDRQIVTHSKRSNNTESLPCNSIFSLSSSFFATRWIHMKSNFCNLNVKQLCNNVTQMSSKRVCNLHFICFNLIVCQHNWTERKKIICG